ncbi:MAG TPA: hypothetical protein VKU90_03715 [Caulobacteraceae bacterium]|nr:hypothetical protein [Caulobacteraceae bacterium]
MKALILGLGLALVGGAAFADALGDFNAGVAAIARHDAAEAVRLFTAALDSGQLTSGDREIAYARRADAELQLGRKTDALADAQAALALAPGDAEAALVRDRAAALDTPAPHGPTINADTRLNAAVAARNAAVEAQAAAAQANYQAALAANAAQKAAQDQAYAAQMAAYQAAVDKANAAHAAWAACKAGDRSQCSNR